MIYDLLYDFFLTMCGSASSTARAELFATYMSYVGIIFVVTLVYRVLRGIVRMIVRW